MFNAKKRRLECEICHYTCSYPSKLKRHKANVHNDGVVWQYCDKEGCNERFKQADHLKQHKANVHNDGVVWQYCDWDGCNKRFKQAGTLKKHKAYVHNDGVVWHYCDKEGCNKKFKQISTLKQHKINIHDIDVDWYFCDQDGCNKKFKQISNLKRHKIDIHDIDVIWYYCDQDSCDKKFKQTSTLKTHKSYIHDIGHHECDYCNRNRNSKNEYVDPNVGKVYICRDCYNRATGKNSRIEKLWSEYVDKHLGTDGLIGSDTSLRSLGGCSRKRPDRLYGDSKLIEIDECDENQHLGGEYTCEQGRLMELYEEPAFFGKPLVVIRWNPDKYKDGPKTSRKDRLELFVELKKTIRKQRQLDKEWPRIVVYYMFYDKDNPGIAKDIEHHFINSKNDILSTIK